MIKYCKVVLVLMLSLVAVCEGWADEPVTVKILDQVKGPFNRALQGQNILGYPALPSNISSTRPLYATQGGGVWDPQHRAPASGMFSLLQQTGAGSLRWPGGCETHEFNWKKAVGPLAQRQDQAFGLPEFLQLCEKLSAIPLISLADYWGTAEDFADLVEYLNSPLGTNPNGGIAWAEVRAADGHPAPYNVKWFEFGNETEHGAHKDHWRKGAQPLTLSATDYAGKFNRLVPVMKAVDPKIKVGAVLCFDVTPEDVGERWMGTVIRQTASAADFYIYHAYLNDGVTGRDSADLYYRRLFTSAHRNSAMFAVMNDRIESCTGKKLPLVISEYNGGYERRFTWGTALAVVDLIFTMQQPENRVALAQYWQFSNEEWGAVAGVKEPYLRRPAWYMFDLVNRFAGDTILSSENSAVSPATPVTDGKPGILKLPTAWEIKPVPGVESTVDAQGGLTVKILTDKDLNYYHAAKSFPARPSVCYLLTAEIRSAQAGNSYAGLQIGDARGWDITRSCSASNLVNSTTWTTVRAIYAALPDTTELTVTARRREGMPAAMTFQIRNIEVKELALTPVSGIPVKRQAYLPDAPARHYNVFCPEDVKPVEVMVTRDTSTRELRVLLLNRSLTATLPVRLDYGQPVEIIAAETLSGAPDATNEQVPGTIKAQPLSFKNMTLALPPVSLTGVKLRLK